MLSPQMQTLLLLAACLLAGCCLLWYLLRLQGSKADTEGQSDKLSADDGEHTAADSVSVIAAEMATPVADAEMPTPVTNVDEDMPASEEQTETEVFLPSGETTCAGPQMMMALAFRPVLAGRGLGVTLPGSLERYQLMAGHLADADDPVALAAMLNDVGCCFAMRGDHQQAITFFDKAIAQIEEAGLPELTCTQTALVGLLALQRVGYDQFGQEHARLLALWKKGTSPLAQRPLLETILSNLNASRIRHMSKNGIALLAQAYNSMEEGNLPSTIRKLRRAVEVVERELPTHLRWPVAAACYDIAVCLSYCAEKGDCEADENEAEASIARAQKTLASCDDAPDWLKHYLARFQGND